MHLIVAKAAGGHLMSARRFGEEEKRCRVPAVSVASPKRREVLCVVSKLAEAISTMEPRPPKQNRFLSDPQSKEVQALFEFVDTDNDGAISLACAINLCRTLGFNVDKRTIHCTSSHVQLEQVLRYLPDITWTCPTAVRTHAAAPTHV